ncbi:MAG: AAA family ATPase [Rhodospirillales bacterium]|nr:AAA family ATPase [Rhodospirillales bacterium]
MSARGEVIDLPVDQWGSVQPPMALEAEQMVLGAAMAFPELMDELRWLEPAHFAASANRRVWEVMRAAVEAGRIADPVTLKPAASEPDIAAAGGVRYIAQLASCAVGRTNALEYARMVFDMYERREVIAVADRMIEQARRGDIERTARHIVAEAEEAFAGFTVSEVDGPRAFVGAVDAAVAAVEKAWRGEGPVGIQTRLADIDDATGGLFPGDLTVLAGATSMGKTALANTICEAVARNGTPVLVFSLEMPSEQLALREVAAGSGVPVPAMRAGRVTPDDMASIVTAGQAARKLPIWVDDRSGLGLAMIVATTKRMMRREGVRLVVVDYLQLVTPSDRYAGQRTNEVSAIARGLKEMARGLNIPVLALSQLSRGLNVRENKRPTLSDLRESGEIEQAADNVWAVYREAYYLKNAEPRKKEREGNEAFTERLVQWQTDVDSCRNEAELILLKQRQGSTDKVTLHFDGKRMRFGNRER